MTTRLRATGLLVRIAFRNLFASKAKTLILGGIVLFGALLVVVGSSLLDTVDRGMRGSIQGSLAGQLQVYSARSKDDLALYGGMMGESQLEPIEDFAALKKVIERVRNVKAVVPMGIDQAMVATGNEFDVALEKLRADVRLWLRGDRTPELIAAYGAHKAHLRRMTTLLRQELSQARAIVDDSLIKERARETADLARATTEAFWGSFDEDPLASLEFLENRIAPQSMSGGFTFIRYAGTDLDAYGQAFDRMRIVEGTPVPKGHRGILIGKLYAEDWLKLKTARRLDRIRDARLLRHRKIARDEELQRWVRENETQTRDILLQLDPLQAEEAAERLRRALGSSKTDLHELLVELFTTDDANFDRRYAIFYDELAPLLQLYTVKVGDTITIKAPSHSGYMSSVNLKVYGFVEFRGLEKSALAGIMSLMDILSWRDLYGYMTAEKSAEIRAIKASAGVREVSRENAERDLFGGPAGEPEAKAVPIEAPIVVGAAEKKADQTLFARSYTPEEMDGGVALNAAVTLVDPSRIKQTQRDIASALSAAGFDMKVVDWQKASGMVGQFVSLARVVLYTAVFIIFAVALVVINNAMVMATLQRVKEIGTLRAIGAQRRFVLAMLVLETTAVGLFFGAVGAALGAGVVWVLRLAGGIPAQNDQLYFFYSGPSLVPRLGATSLFVALAIVIVVSVLSGLYPGLIAARVTPLEAMQSDE
ncbi:MAG TPA: FtsX-like permease family protein [Anaeromyxobacteraceae bacterium]|nr:FtsX-like permease family protein [Anaeromyxobacteraceae bacterium]